MKKKLIYITRYSLLITLILSSNFVLAGELQLGLAVINSHSAIHGKSEETRFLPAIIYQGENFSFIYDTLSYKLFSSDSLSFAVTAKQREKTFELKDSEALNGMDIRDDSFDMGFNIESAKSWGTLELAVSGDVSTTYDGYEVKASYSYPWIKGRWLLKPAVGVSYLSQQLVGYYYGVKNSEQKMNRPAYSGEASVNSYVEISIFYQLSEKWTAIAGMGYVYLNDAITNSPIVDEKNETTAFSALTYSF